MVRSKVQPKTTIRTISPDVAHIVWKDDQMEGYIMGKEIVALCGEVFIPSKDFENLPVCEPCREVRDHILGLG